MQGKGENKQVYYQLLRKCALELTATQRKNLPPELKSVVDEKYQQIELKKKL